MELNDLDKPKNKLFFHSDNTIMMKCWGKVQFAMKIFLRQISEIKGCPAGRPAQPRRRPLHEGDGTERQGVGRQARHGNDVSEGS